MYKSADWDLFAAKLDHISSNTDGEGSVLEESVAFLNGAILHAAKETILRGSIRDPKPWWCAEVATVIKQRRERAEKKTPGKRLFALAFQIASEEAK